MYLNFPCVLQTVAVFVWFSRLRLEREGVNRAMRRLSSADCTVYLAHKFVVYALCVGVHAIASRVPGLRRMLPQKCRLRFQAGYAILFSACMKKGKVFGMVKRRMSF